MAPDTNMVLSSKLGRDSTMAPDDSSIGHPDWPGPGGDMALRHQHGLDFNVISASGGRQHRPLSLVRFQWQCGTWTNILNS